MELKSNTKLIVGIIIILIVIVGGYFVFNKNQSVNQTTNNEPIKIGVIVPLTGPYAFLGEEIKKGVELAAEEAKNQEMNFAITYEDDQGNFGPGTVNAANKLVNIDKINAGITFGIEEAKPIAPIFNNAKIPLVVGWDSNDFIKGAGDYIFSNGFSTEKAGEKIAEFAYKNLSLRKVAIVSHIDAWVDIISASFKNKFTELGGSIVYNERISPEATDYKTIILKVKNSKADGVYAPTMPMNSAIFIIQAKQLGLNVPLMMGDSFVQEVIDEVKSSGEGIYFTSMIAEKNDPVSILYKNKYQTDPYGLALAAAGYDAFKKFVDEKITVNNVRDILLKNIGPSRTSEREEKLYQVKNGLPIEIK